MSDIRLSTEHVFNAGTMRFATFPTDHTNTSMGLVAEDGEDTAKAEILHEDRAIFKETYIPDILREESCSVD